MFSLYYTVYNPDLSQHAFYKGLNLLPAVLQKKILKYHRPQDAQLCLLGKLLLRKGLADYGVDPDLSGLFFAKYGKPFLNRGVSFNISHSGNYVVCVFSNSCEVGVDIEEIKPIPVNDFSTHFVIEEWQDILNADDMNRSFYHFWTAKEAIVKAHGKGLNIPLKEVFIKDGASLIDGERWYYRQVSLSDNYLTHLAANHPLTNIQVTYINGDTIMLG